MAESVVTGPVRLPAQRDQLAAWLGRRVVVRHMLPDGRATDVLGTLEAVEDASLTVRADSDGRREVVGQHDVVAAKPVPPRPVRRPRTGPAGTATDAATDADADVDVDGQD